MNILHWLWIYQDKGISTLPKPDSEKTIPYQQLLFPWDLYDSLIARENYKAKVKCILTFSTTNSTAMVVKSQIECISSIIILFYGH